MRVVNVCTVCTINVGEEVYFGVGSNPNVCSLYTNQHADSVNEAFLPHTMLAFAALICACAWATAAGETALVLGSGGLVGQGLVHQLHASGWNVLEVRNGGGVRNFCYHVCYLSMQVTNRTHNDLRVPGALDHFVYVEFSLPLAWLAAVMSIWCNAQGCGN